jgi:hypothetical protein
MSEDPRLERWVWTDEDFEAMDWRHACVHAVPVEDDGRSRVLLDLDHIVGGVVSEPPGRELSFRLAPATLVFEKVWDLKGESRCGIRQGAAGDTPDQRRSARERRDEGRGSRPQGAMDQQDGRPARLLPGIAG